MTMDRAKALQALDEADKINNAPGAFRDECIEAYQLIEPHFPTFRAALTAPDASVAPEMEVTACPDCFGTGLNPINSSPTPCFKCYPHKGKVLRQRFPTLKQTPDTELLEAAKEAVILAAQDVVMADTYKHPVLSRADAVKQGVDRLHDAVKRLAAFQIGGEKAIAKHSGRG